VTFGILKTYKLHVRAYGGKSDEDLSQMCEHTGTVQKWINLLDNILDEYKGKGHCVTMDSAYMGDILTQVGHSEWKINMVGTAQANCTRAEVKEELNKIKRGTYESLCFQHRTKSLCFAFWSDNNLVKTLSNFHPPTI
jgi:hypothetical protein